MLEMDTGESDGLGRTGGGDTLALDEIFVDTLVGVIGGGRLAGTGLCPYTGGVLMDDDAEPFSRGLVRLDGLGDRFCASASPRTVSSSVRFNVFLATSSSRSLFV